MTRSTDRMAMTWEQYGPHWYVSGPYSIYITYAPAVRARVYRCWDQVGPVLDSLRKAKHAARLDRNRRTALE